MGLAVPYVRSPDPVSINVYFVGMQVVGWKPNVDVGYIR